MAIKTARLGNALTEFGDCFRAERSGRSFCRHLHFCLTAVRKKTRVDGLMKFELNIECKPPLISGVLITSVT